MNLGEVSMVVLKDVTPVVVPRHLGFLNTVLINLHNETEELVQDQNGTVTSLGSYSAPNVPQIVLHPMHFFTPRVISRRLHRYIANSSYCHDLGHEIARDCASLHGHGGFIFSFNVKVTRQVLFTLPPVVVTVPSAAASDDMLQRLVDEQKVELLDLEGDKEATPSCSICLENLAESESIDENVIRMPNCLHMFHQGCIVEWLKLQNSCPLCRRVLYEDGGHIEV